MTKYEILFLASVGYPMVLMLIANVLMLVINVLIFDANVLILMLMF